MSRIAAQNRCPKGISRSALRRTSSKCSGPQNLTPAFRRYQKPMLLWFWGQVNVKAKPPQRHEVPDFDSEQWKECARRCAKSLACTGCAWEGEERLVIADCHGSWHTEAGWSAKGWENLCPNQHDLERSASLWLATLAWVQFESSSHGIQGNWVAVRSMWNPRHRRWIYRWMERGDGSFRWLGFSTSRPWLECHSAACLEAGRSPDHFGTKRHFGKTLDVSGALSLFLLANYLLRCSQWMQQMPFLDACVDNILVQR